MCIRDSTGGHIGIFSVRVKVHAIGDAKPFTLAYVAVPLGVILFVFAHEMCIRDRDYTLAGESLRICALDTCVAICSGLIIFPACFSYGVSPDAGPKLIFITLPNVFANMTGGRLWGTLFFVFMTFASFSTIIAVFQNILACLQESFGWSLKRACAVGTVFILLASVPCIDVYKRQPLTTAIFPAWCSALPP